LYKASKYHKIACLITIFPKSVENPLFHYPNLYLVNFQSKALGIPVIKEYCVDTESDSLNTLRKALTKAVKKYNIKGVVTGAIKSTYQASRFQRICYELNLWCFNPLWLSNQISILNEVLNLNFKVIISRIAGYPLKKELVGKQLNEKLIRYFMSIRNFLNPAGEGGEYETIVLDMPLFKKRIDIIDFEIVGEDYDATLVIKKVKLLGK